MLAVAEVCHREIAIAQFCKSEIRPIDPLKVEDLILRLSGSNTIPSANSDLLPKLIIGGHKIHVTKRRIGQQDFRLSLLNRNGENCFISGSQPSCVLEASHIRPFAIHGAHSVDGGILLRRDLHALFDRFLPRINPSTWQVEAAQQIKSYPTFSSIHLKQLDLHNDLAPRVEWLNDHYLAAEANFNC